MCQHRLLLVRLNPVQQVHSLRLVVVEPGNLLRQQGEKKRAQMEIAVKQTELLQHNLRALHTFCAFVLLKFFPKVVIDLIARNQFALHRVLNRQLGIAAGKTQNLIHRAKQLLRLLFRHGSLHRGLGRRLTRIRSCGLACIGHITNCK